MYFGNTVTSISTIMLLTELGYIGYNVFKHKEIQYWGRRIAILAMWGLLLCCFVAMRDNYHLSVQASFDANVLPGRFEIDSIQSNLCCIGGGVIAFSAISSIFVKKQKYRKAMFMVLGATIIIKTLVIEISRWMM